MSMAIIFLYPIEIGEGVHEYGAMSLYAQA